MMYVLAYDGDWYFSGIFDHYQTPLCLHNPDDDRIQKYDTRKDAQKAIDENPKLKNFKVKMARREGTV